MDQYRLKQECPDAGAQHSAQIGPPEQGPEVDATTRDDRHDRDPEPYAP